jgi:glycosyltransferase involved in cell wall biosynthesis
VELSRQEQTYAWQVDRRDLPSHLISVIPDSPLEQVPLVHLLSQLITVLTRLQPDIVAIAGYAHPAMLTALGWSLWHRKPAILMSETTAWDNPRHWLQEMLKSWIVKQYQSALVGGSPQARYLIELGMPATTICFGYDVVDNQVFHPDRCHHFPRPISRPYFLSVSRFVPKKNLPFLLAAYAQYRQVVGDVAWDLVLSGDGPLRAQLEQQIAELNLEPWVHLPGFLQQTELLPYFAHAGCFVHASTQEQWGLVVNEAMAAGLPVLVSNRCGCFEDLVLEGVTGFGFDPANELQLTDLMTKITLAAGQLETMRQATLAHIQKFSPDCFAIGLIQAIQYAHTLKRG